MAKFAPVAAILAGLLLVSLAAATTTTVEINEGEDNPFRGRGGVRERCREQLEEADELRHCEDFLREQVQEGGFERRRFGREDPYERYGDEERRRGRFGGDEESRRGRFGGDEESRRGRFGGDEERRRGRFGGDEGRGSRRLRNCCQQLRQLDDQCRCEGLREIIRDQQQRQRGFGEEREELERIAENLPQMCGVGPGRCDIRRGSSWM